MRINSVPDVKCFYNNKNVLRVQPMVRHFVRHSVYTVQIGNIEMVSVVVKRAVRCVISLLCGVQKDRSRRQTMKLRPQIVLTKK